MMIAIDGVSIDDYNDDDDDMVIIMMMLIQKEQEQENQEEQKVNKTRKTPIKEPKEK